VSPLVLEIIEGPGAGLTVPLQGPTVIGRGDDADLVLNNEYTSRAHARISPAPDEHAIVEDLESSNGTFVNDQAVHGSTKMSPGDNLLVGVSVFTLRTEVEIDRRTTAIRNVPLALAAPQPPTLAAPQPSKEMSALGEPAKSPQMSELERLLDVNVKFRARTAPLAMLVLVALVVAIYLGAR
jgi:pSer/pThr/pTyr-binding forkhead associated (FHA) protein